VQAKAALHSGNQMFDDWNTHLFLQPTFLFAETSFVDQRRFAPGKIVKPMLPDESGSRRK
jgi:hypothetical protein